jgi:hypothetical protein|eukprot:COSAG02_NODE_2637_length_8357_cov_7.120974_13_plen_90_part_00
MPSGWIFTLCAWAAEITSIVGEDAKAAGLGGIYNVGRASTVPPRLVILKWTPPDPVAAVGATHLAGSLAPVCPTCQDAVLRPYLLDLHL